MGKLKRVDALSDRELPLVSVIVPARNEDHNLEETLTSLASQDYPAEKYQVVMVNDRSGDATPQIMEGFTRQYRNFVQVDIDSQPFGVSPKKNAIEWGIAASSGEIIFTTDADCIHSPRWLRTMASYYRPKVGLVAGLTIFHPDNETLAHRLHSLDFLSYAFVGGGAIGNGSANTCTGANFSFRLKAFHQLGGYAEAAKMVSGDDEFFLQELVKSKKWKAVYALGPQSIVRSLPPETFKGLVNQRLRWGSKGTHYPKRVRRVAAGLFLFLLGLTLWPALVWGNVLPLGVFLFCAALKFVMDFMVMRRGCRIYGFRFPYVTFIALSLIHPALLTLSAIGGHLLPFTWKGERFRSKVKV